MSNWIFEPKKYIVFNLLLSVFRVAVRKCSYIFLQNLTKANILKQKETNFYREIGGKRSWEIFGKFVLCTFTG